MTISRTPTPAELSRFLHHEIHRAKDVLDMDRIRYLIKAGADLDTPIPGQGDYPLIASAALLGRASIIEALIEGKANLETRTATGRTALHIAMNANSEGACARVLIAAGADVDAKDYKGQSILALMIERNDVQGVKLLTAIGAKMDHVWKMHEAATPPPELKDAVEKHRLIGDHFRAIEAARAATSEWLKQGMQLRRNLKTPPKIKLQGRRYG